MSEEKNIPKNITPKNIIDELPKEFRFHLEEKYELLKEVGVGSVGVVIKAKDKFLEREVAIKLFIPRIREADDEYKRFENEAKIIAQLDHPNIVTVYEYGHHSNIRYIVENFLAGGSLTDALRDKKRFSQNETLKIIKYILEGLDYAHQREVIHRDLKPDNIILTEDGIPVITDFGIAKMMTKRESYHTVQTNLDSYLGTPEFVSPEQAKSKPLDKRTDIYSVGVIMYYMITGKLPFVGEDPLAIAYKQVYEDPIPPSTLQDDIEKSTENVILKAMSKNKEDRYSSVSEFVNDIDLLSFDGEVSKTIASKAVVIKEKKDNKILFSIIAFLLAVILFIGYQYYSNLEPKGLHIIRRGLHVSASSTDDPETDRYKAKNTIDGDRTTVWAENAESSGNGEYLVFTFDEPKLIEKVGIVGGYDKVVNDKYGDRWDRNNRLKRIRVTYSDRSEEVVNLRDSRDIQYFSVGKELKYFKIEILEVYRGSNKDWNDTSIAEVEIWGMSIEK